MGWTLVIAIALTLVALVHLLFLRIPEEQPVPAEGERASTIDFRGSVAAVRPAPGLFALILFSTFNNLIGGVYMALMDPYGLTIFPVEVVGGRARRHGHRLHHRRSRDREVRAREQPHPHDAAGRDRHGRARRALHDPRVVGAVRRSASGLHVRSSRWSRRPSRPSSRRSCRSGARVASSASPRRSSRRPRPSRRSSSRRSRSSGSSRTWSPTAARRRGAGCSATATPAASRSCSSSRGLVMVVLALLAFTTRSYRLLSAEYRGRQ